MTPDQGLIENQSLLALQHLVTRASVILMHRKSRANGSGTVIQVGNKYLVATAGHVLEDFPPSDLMIAPTTRPTWSNDAATALHIATRVHPGIDVGLVEIAPHVVSELEIEPRPITDLAVKEWDIYGRLAMVVGAPSALHRIDERGKSYVGVTAATTYPIRPAHWTQIRDRYPAFEPFDERTTILLDYADNEWKSTGDGSSVRPFDAPGLSGGGIWQSDRADGVWRATPILIGIQFAWNPTPPYRLLRGVSIAAWIELVDSAYPGLRAERT